MSIDIEDEPLPEDDAMPNLQQIIGGALWDYEQDKRRERLNDPAYGSKLP